MANFLRINELPVSVLQANAGDDLAIIGTSERAQDGTMRIERRNVKGKWQFTLTHQSAADALAWRDLVLGRGQHWSFEAAGATGLYGSKGTGFTGAGVAVSSTHAKFGSQSLKVNASSTATAAKVVKGTAAGFGWLAQFWFWNGSAFDHYLLTSTAGGTVSKWLNGTPGSPATGWFSMSSAGTLTLGDGSDRYFDDLVVLDLVAGAPATGWAAAMAAKTVPFSDLAQLKVDGDGIDGNARTVTVQGSCGQAQVIGAQLGGSWTDNVHVLPVMFEEI